MPAVLDKLDLSVRLSRDEYEQRLLLAQRRLSQLRLHLGGQMGDPAGGPALLVVFEGPDAAGKGGAIKAIVGHLDPRHYRVCNFSAPTKEEKDHHFLWRFWNVLPGLREMTVYDRSWYGRVLVERVEGFASTAEWQRAYRSIVRFEESLVEEGAIVVKFWIQISDEEQARRFQARADDPFKQWKLTPEDWRNRDKNRVYEAAAEEMFAKTSHRLARWDIIPGDQKRFARVAVVETLNRRIEQGLARWGMPVPEFDEPASTIGDASSKRR